MISQCTLGMKAFLVLFALCCTLSADDEEPTEAQRIQQEVLKIQDAVYGNDIDTVIEFTHPTIIEMMGGVEDAKSALTEALQQIAELEISIESRSFPSEPVFLEGGDTRFVIVPTLTVVQANGRQIESLNYQLGVLDADAAGWKYVEGSRINSENVRTLFPDFPEDYEFPETYRNLVE